jgi:hypothetical protein
MNGSVRPVCEGPMKIGLPAGTLQEARGICSDWTETFQDLLSLH